MAWISTKPIESSMQPLATWTSSCSTPRGQASEQSAQADQQYQQTAQATEEDINNFKKAFSVCLEAQNYMVKY